MTWPSLDEIVGRLDLLQHATRDSDDQAEGLVLIGQLLALILDEFRTWSGDTGGLVVGTVSADESAEVVAAAIDRLTAAVDAGRRNEARDA